MGSRGFTRHTSVRRTLVYNYSISHSVKTTGLAGGLHRPYKGLLPAAPKRCTEYLSFARIAPLLLK